MNSNHVTALDKLVMLAAWARERGHFTGREAAIYVGMSVRTTYRYLNAIKAIDDRLSGEAGVGYYYRKGHPHVRSQAA